jgi:hypothetical protein
MKPPILIFEGRDVSIHPSLEHARFFSEVIDVKAGMYEVYDSEGLLLDLKIISKRGREEAVIEERQPAVFQAAELHQRLVEYLKIGKLSIPDLEQETTMELMRRVAKHMPWKLRI